MIERVAVLVISYARPDREIVRPLVRLLRSALTGIERAVYWDDDFEPGQPWFEQIKSHIVAAQQLFVFWCNHSATSAQVRREFEYAIDDPRLRASPEAISWARDFEKEIGEMFSPFIMTER